MGATPPTGKSGVVTTTTTGPAHACWYCGLPVLDGCTHHCPTAVPKVIYPGTSVIAPGCVVRLWP